MCIECVHVTHSVSIKQATTHLSCVPGMLLDLCLFIIDAQLDMTGTPLKVEFLNNFETIFSRTV